MSRKPNTNRWLGKRGIHQPEPVNLQPQELVEAAQKLGGIIGSGEYYKWARTLGRLVLNPQKYLAEINKKLAEFEEECNDNGITGSCTCKKCLAGSPNKKEKEMVF